MARFSLCELLPELPTIEVIDIGALDMAGQEPLHGPLVAAGRARVTGFEPDLAGCVALNQRYGRPHRFYPQFVGNGKPAKFYQTNAPYTGSLYPPNTPLLEAFNDLGEVTLLVQVHDVSTVRLDDLEEIEGADYLKIDVQGAEIDVFTGAQRVLDSAVVIQTEVSFVELYRGQPFFADVDAYLRNHGFWFHTFLGFGMRSFKPLRVGEPGNPAGGVDRGLNQKLWGEALYIKDPLQLDKLSTAKLQTFAVLMHDILKSYDVAVGCLRAIDARTGTQLALRYAERLTGVEALKTD
jgi:FkbM family methyltransferase